MKKILLLENKEYRQDKLLFDLSNYDFIENILGDLECNELLDQFLMDPSIFQNYDVIIIHESIYFDDKRDLLFSTLSEKCTNKRLVKFSGNNTQFSLENELTLQVNPSVLYENIEVFLESYRKDNSNILILALGEKWQLNVLLNTLEKLNIFIENRDEYPINKSIFSSKVGLRKIKEVSMGNFNTIFQNINSNRLKKEDIEIISFNLQKLIKEVIHD